MSGITLEEALKHKGSTDREKVLATTDEDIDRLCDEDEDQIRDLTALGDPLPDLKRIRAKLGVSQDGLAMALGIPPATLRNWEQRRRMPDPTAVALMRIIEREPEAVFRALGSKPKPKRAGKEKVA